MRKTFAASQFNRCPSHQFAEELAGRVDNWIDFHNALFGIGGKLGELFPSESDRTQFSKTPEFVRSRNC